MTLDPSPSAQERKKKRKRRKGEKERVTVLCPSLVSKSEEDSHVAQKHVTLLKLPVFSEGAPRM